MEPMKLIFENTKRENLTKEIYGGTNDYENPRFQELAFPIFSLSNTKSNQTEKIFESTSCEDMLPENVFEIILQSVSGNKMRRRLTKSKRPLTKNRFSRKLR